MLFLATGRRKKGKNGTTQGNRRNKGRSQAIPEQEKEMSPRSQGGKGAYKTKTGKKKKQYNPHLSPKSGSIEEKRTKKASV